MHAESKADRIKDEVPLHRAQLAASEKRGPELGKMGAGSEVQVSLCFV